MNSLAFPAILKSLFEDTSTGKVVSIGGVGFVLALAISFSLSAHLGISLMPIDTLKKTNEKLTDAKHTVKEIQSQIDQILARETRDHPAKFAQSKALQNSYRTTHFNIVIDVAKKKLDEIDSSIMAIQGKMASNQNSSTNQLTALLKRQNIKKRKEQNNLAKLDAVNVAWQEQKAKVVTLTNKIGSDLSLIQNIQVLGENVWSIIVVSVILGVGMGQISRLFFWLFDKPIGASVGNRSDDRVLLTDEQQLQRKTLVESKFRHAESAINLALPVAALGLGLSDYIISWDIVQIAMQVTEIEVTKGASEAAAQTTLVIALIASALLMFSGYQTHKSFRRKETIFFEHALPSSTPTQSSSSGTADASSGADGTTSPPA